MSWRAQRGTKYVIARAAWQSMHLWTTVDRFVPRDDAIPVMVSAARHTICHCERSAAIHAFVDHDESLCPW
jgi:hypothetical protein